jgi:exosortase
MATVGTETRTEAVFRIGSFTIPRNLALAVAAIGALFIALNYSGIRLLMDLWDSDSNYGHGYLIPFISLYFVWTKKEELLKRVPEPCLWGLGLFLAGLPLWFMSRPLTSPVLAGLAIVLMVNGLVLYLGGTKLYRILWLPALYLIFMVPLPQPVYAAMANPLQRFASWSAAGILDGILGIPTLRDGNVIKLAGHQLQVAEACSGMRSIMGLLALGVAFAYFWERSLWERLLLIVSTVPIAIIANICRVTGTGVMYNMGHEKFAQGFYHEFTGWFVFIFAMALFLLEAYLLSHLFVYDHKPGTPAAPGAPDGGKRA